MVFSAAACDEEADVSTEEARGYLAELPFEISYKDAGDPDVLAGVARAGNGAAIRFALALEGAEIPKRLLRSFGDPPPLVSSPTYDIVTEDVIGAGDSPALARKRSGMGLRLETAICRHAEEGCGV